MIHIQELDNCCGCHACASRCPKQCISMQRDDKGFLYPKVDEASCIDCGLCEKVCPMLNVPEADQPIHAYAAQNINQKVRATSSSGGVFSVLAEQTIAEGGVVFGAAFDNKWMVHHVAVRTGEDLRSLRGSKYVQSTIGSTYIEAEKELKAGRKVLFSGTPCQIAGLRTFLHKPYENLTAVDVVCHGVPSPAVWAEYINSLARSKSVPSKNTVLSSLNDSRQISGVSFRDKRTGWQKYGFAVYSSDQREDENSVLPSKSKLIHYSTVMSNIFMRGFLQNVYLRPSCYHCRFRCFRSGSDLTLADLWGVRQVAQQFDDDKGTSLVLDKGGKFSETASLSCIELTSEQVQLAYKGNPSLFNDEPESKYSNAFWQEFFAHPEKVQDAIRHHTVVSRKAEMKNHIDKIMLKLNLYTPVQQLVRKIKYGK